VGEAAPARVVLDTNVAISALIFRSGPTAKLRRLWLERKVVLLASAETTKELLRVLAYPKFRLSAAQREELLAEYLPYARAVKPGDRPNALAHLPACRDPHDVKFLELAQAGDADLLITGDKDLLVLNDPSMRHMGFAIVQPAEALMRWEN
jgi:uncharacterized protein